MPHPDLHAKHAVFGIYSNHSTVEKAVEQLKQAGLKADEISVLMPHKKAVHLIHDPENATADNVEMGVLAGGSLGWLAGSVLVMLPGLGAAIVGGPIAWAFLALGAGAGAGGILGGLFGLGLTEKEVKHYSGRIHKGDMLLSVHCADGARTMKAKEILIHTGAEDVYARAAMKPPALS